MTQQVKILPAIQEIQVQSLDWEDLLENSMDRGAWWVSPWGHKELDMIKHIPHSCILTET